METSAFLEDIDHVITGLKEQLNILNKIRSKIDMGKDMEDIEWSKNKKQ